VLVGRPGLGKGAAINPIIALLKEANVVNLLSDRITMEYVLEKLSKGFTKQSVQLGGQTFKLGTEATALLVSTELSVFITASQFAITALSDLWDSKEGVYGYGTRGKGECNINSPCISLLGGSAQEWLVKSVPADAVGGGFTRRVNFVFSAKKDRKIAWPTNSNGSRSDLVSTLRQMSSLSGEFRFDIGARALFSGYYDSCEPDEFDDAASAVYKTSKWANASKIAMCLSAARGHNMLITKDDFEDAIVKTEEVARDLKIVFRAVGESELSVACDKVLRFVEAKGYATRQEIIKFNWRDISTDDLDKVLATLREGGIIGERTVGGKTLYFSVQSTQKGTP
jgi:hypothetical protein